MSSTNYPPSPSFHQRHPRPTMMMMVNNNGITKRTTLPNCNNISPDASCKPEVSFFLSNDSLHHRCDHAVVRGILKSQLPPQHSSSSSSIPAKVNNVQGRVRMMECHSQSSDHRAWMERDCSNSINSSSINSGARREHHHHPYYHHHQHCLRLPTIQHIHQTQPLIKKKVTFSPTCTVTLDTRKREPVATTTENCNSNNNNNNKDPMNPLYYTKSELNTMYRETHAICTVSQTLLSPEQYQLAKAARQDTIFAPASLRGLELMIYPTRRKNKYLAIRSFLKYQALLNSKDYSSDSSMLMSVEKKQVALALASAKLTAWSSLVAEETGRLDALAVHDGMEDSPVVPPSKEAAAQNGTLLPFYKEDSNTTDTTVAPPPPILMTSTTNHHPTRPKQERRWSRRVTMEGEEHQKRTLLLKKRKILM